MSEKMTMTLNLSEKEMDILTDLAKKKSLTKTALVRQALRLYQTVENQLESGDRIFIENGLRKKQLIIL